MRNDEHLLYDEIVAVLNAEYACAESLQATSTEIQSLIDAEKFSQVQERLFSRGEVVALMSSLDQQLAELLAQQPYDSFVDGWDEVISLARNLRELIASAMSIDKVSRARLEQNCKDIGERLRSLQNGQRLVRSYGQCFDDPHHPLMNA